MGVLVCGCVGVFSKKDCVRKLKQFVLRFLMLCYVRDQQIENNIKRWIILFLS